MIKKKTWKYLAIAAGIIMASCSKEDNGPLATRPDIASGQGVFVANEGNFGWGNASLSYYDKKNDTIHHDYFRNANGETPGDVLQSITMHKGLAYLVVNNSGKIEVMDPKTGHRHSTITGMVSPRYMLPVTDDKAYVSDLFGNHIRIVDLQTSTITGEIPLNGWTEAMVELRGNVYVTGMQSGYVYELDPAGDQLIDSLYLPPGPVSMVVDSNEHLWVLSGGAPMFKNEPTLYQLEKNSFGIKKQYHLPDPGFIYNNLSICPEGETLYFLGENVYRMNITSANPQPEKFIPSEGRFFYALSVDPFNGDIYLSDPIDFEQKGKMMRYDKEGQLLNTLNTGIIPGSFTFY